MAVIDLTDANFRETYENNDIVVIDFWAPWCGPCQAFGPIFEAVADKFEDVAFGKVNTEVEQGIAGHFQVRSIPTLMVVREGVEVFYQPGVLDEATLTELVTKVKELDMEDVKKKIAEEEAKQK